MAQSAGSTFGHVIRSGEPVVDSMKIREIKKFDKADVPPKLRRDFVLKDKVVNFMDYLEPGSYKRYEDYFVRAPLLELSRTFGENLVM